ncbi:Rab3 GTPase-activating protein non-catalytic subunit [Chamberlinius hualienensis]
MSCQIIPISSINNIRQIRKLLFPDWNDKEDTTTDWQHFEWSWKSVDESEDGNSDDTWLQNCLITISPVGDVMAIANEDTIVFLNLKWDGNAEQGTSEKFIVVGTEALPASEDFDGITCLFCLPIASQKRSCFGRPDWTAVVVGTRLGHVKFFTETGILLISQKFHDEPVTIIKCRTYDPFLGAALAEQNEEMSILYKKTIVTIDGFGLYQTLRACRNQVARATAHGGEAVSLPPILHKKLVFQDHELIHDCENIGSTYTNMFDSMVLESVAHGIGHPSFSSSVATAFVTTGQLPYSSFCYAVEGSGPTLDMKDVALAAASKVKSVITNFFVSSKPPAPDSNNRKIEPPISLTSRSELRDASRIGEKIFTSPNRRLSAITDEFGRVVLIDNVERTAVRVWKGYRDAQCGWIEVCEENLEATEGKIHLPGPPRIANFLVIYGPRRGILEVWAMQQGPRITAFNVPKNSRLIYCNHGILGSKCVKSAAEAKSQTRRCYFLDSDGFIKAINIPFHYALSAKYSKRARDLHLINKIRTSLKSAVEYSSEFISEVTTAVLDIKTTSIISQAIDVLVNDKHVTQGLLKHVITNLKDQLFAQDPDSLDLESKLLYVNCLQKLQLLDLYKNILELNDSIGSCSEEESELKPLRLLAGIFQMTEREVDDKLGRIGKFFSVCPRKSVKFESDKHLAAGPFLSCFQTNSTHLPKFETFSDIELPVPITLEKSVEDDKLNILSCTIFGCMKQGASDIVDVQAALLKSGIEMKALLNLLFKCWLEKKDNVTDHKCLNLFYKLIVFICSSDDIRHSVVECEDESPLWKNVRRIFYLSTNIAAAYLGALTCRGVTISFYTPVAADNPESTCSDKTPESPSLEWETLNLDIENWSLLVKQLEDVIVLGTIMYYKLPPELLAPSLRSSDNGNSDSAVDNLLSVSYVLGKGKGAISEIIAKWTCSLQYATLLELKLLNPGDRFDEYYFFHNDHFRAVPTKLDGFKECIDDLKACIEEGKLLFPSSFNSDVWIANCCWEFAALWNKDKECYMYLINSVRCLNQVSSSGYRKGLTMMLWHTFLGRTHLATALLIEKIGKVPKDRLCRKEIGMSDVAIKHFIGCCLCLLDSLLQIFKFRLDTISQLFIYEDPWQSERSKAPSNLIDIIVSQKEPNIDLVLHHYTLAAILHMIWTFEMKSVKPLCFHSTMSHSVLVKELSTAISFSTVPDAHSAISENQTQFLRRVIILMVSAISLPAFDNDVASPVSSFVKTEIGRSRLWLDKVMELAEIWGLDRDQYRRLYICEMFSSGFDYVAQELIPAVAERDTLASQLMDIVGQRIYNAIQSSGEKYVNYLTLFTPSVTNWFKTLNLSSLRNPNTPLSMVIPIIEFILKVKDSRNDYKFALSVFQSVQYMISSIEKSQD